MKEAFQDLPLGKTPGLDGLPVAFYHMFLPQLQPDLLRLYNSSATTGPTPTMGQIALLPKLGKDPALCSSYCPIALLNTDLKIYTKMLVKRLKPHMPGLVEPDQVGFIRKRQGVDNVLRIAHLVG